jgi:uncharacterized protein (DUF924 family)
VRDSPENILDFWFGDTLHSAAAVPARTKLWFTRNADFDTEIERRFGSLPERALRGEFDAWCGEPRPALALVLMLDQFPRNLFRGSARSFAFDARAREVAAGSVDAGFLEELHPIEAVFLCLPFEHSEDVDDQTRCVALIEQLAGHAPDDLQRPFQQFVEYARQHRDVVRRFGRFPLRNAALGRSSTAEELAYQAALTSEESDR